MVLPRQLPLALSGVVAVLSFAFFYGMFARSADPLGIVLLGWPVAFTLVAYAVGVGLRRVWMGVSEAPVFVSRAKVWWAIVGLNIVACAWVASLTRG